MDTKEILWDSNRPKFGDSTVLGENAVAPLGPLVGIEEDLQRAITALRAVPTFSWSVDSLLEGQGQGRGHAVTSAEYVWKAEDFDWPYKDRPLYDRQLYVDGETPSDFGRSEIRTDTFTALSQRIHLAPDKSCRISDENRSASFRVCLSGQKKNLAENSSSNSSSAYSKASQKMSKPPPHRHPLSSSSRSNSDVPRRAAPPVLPRLPAPPRDPRRMRGEFDGAKTDKRNGVQRPETREEDTSDAVRGIFDFYERSLDILESEELKRKKRSEVSSPRSNSPETLLEELLDSISADEYDTLPSSESKNKDSAKRVLPLSAKTKEIHGHISSSSSSSAERWKPCETKTFMLTGFQNLVSESSEPENISAREQNNNDVACHDQAIEHPTGLSNTKQTQGATVSSIQGYTQLPTTSAVYQTRHSDPAIDETEPTPEDIFEEIMDSMETSGGKRKENSVAARGCLDTAGRIRQAFPNDAKNDVRSESVFGFSRDYCADNGLLSVHYNRSRSGMQLCLREKIRKSRSDDFAAAAAAKNPAPLSMDIHPDSGKPSTTTPSPVSSSSLSSASSSSACPPPPPETRPTSRRAQDAIYCTVRQKPAPPLRQKATTSQLPSLSLSLSCFAAEQQQHTLLYNVRQPSVSKQQSAPSSEVGCSPRETTADFEAECDSSADRRPSPADQGVRVLEPLPKDPAKDSPTDEEAKKASSTGVVEDAKYQPLLLPDEEKTNGEEILFSSGFADDKKKNHVGEEEEEEGEEIDLDLDAEFSRNLDACTGSDVECPGIDKLMSAESHADRSIIAEKNNCTKQKMKSPGKLGILIAKRRLRKAPHAVDGCEEAPSTGPDLSQPSSYHQESKTDPTLNPSQPGSDQVVASTHGGTDGRYGNFYGAIGDVSDPEIGKDVRRRCETRVLSEEVTSQELLLKFVWPKKDVAGMLLGKTTPQRTPKKPPFRELQLHRMLRICDDDSNYPSPDPDPRRLSQTNATRDVRALPELEYRHDSPVPEEYATEKPDYRSGTCRRIEHVSGSPVSVVQRETMRVIRAPLANGHAVENIKQVVEGVGYTIIRDFERSPVKRNIKVSCEATESKSESAIRDHQDVTVIRNTILDTLRPNTTPALLRQGSSVPDDH